MSIPLQLTVNTASSLVLVLTLALALCAQVIKLRVLSVSLIAAAAGGAYAGSALAGLLGTDAAAVAAAGGAVGGAFVGLAGGLLDARFASRGQSVLVLIASLGFLWIVQACIILTTGGAISALSLAFWPPAPTFRGAYAPAWFSLGLGLLVMALVVDRILFGTGYWGKVALAAGDDRELAALFGLPTTQVRNAAQVMGGAIAGITGVVLAADQGLRPDLGLGLALKAFAVLIISDGGLGSLLLAALLLCGTEQLITYFWGGQLGEASGVSFLVVGLIGRAAVRRWREGHPRWAEVP